MTDKQQEKIIELRKLGIGYRSIATAMNMSRDKVRNFCKAQGLDGYGKNNKKADGEKTIRELCKNCGRQGLDGRFLPGLHGKRQDRRQDLCHPVPALHPGSVLEQGCLQGCRSRP